MGHSSLGSLSQTTTGLDSLIGGASALEMADDGDPAYLKTLSERVAAEADKSDSEQKQIDDKLDSIRQRELEKKKNANVLTVDKAREMARKLNEQMEQGVAEAEERQRQADLYLKRIKQGRGAPSPKGFTLLDLDPAVEEA